MFPTKILGALSLGVKRPGPEADHSPPSNAEIKNAWSYTFTPQYVFMAWCLVKHRNDFTFTFYLTQFSSLQKVLHAPPISSLFSFNAMLLFVEKSK
jgi:hypothetical protein